MAGVIRREVCLVCGVDLASGVSSSGVPLSSGEALGMVLAGLKWFSGADLGSAPAVVLADRLRELEDAESLLTAARAGVLSAFDRQRGFENDGHGGARSWLRWQTKVSNGAASGSVGWMRRLRSHCLVTEALASAGISASWPGQVCEWTDLFPAEARDAADAILLQAAADGADLKDLAVIAEELRAKLARPDGDGSGGPGGPGGRGGPDGGEPAKDGRVWLGAARGGGGRGGGGRGRRRAGEGRAGVAGDDDGRGGPAGG